MCEISGHRGKVRNGISLTFDRFRFSRCCLRIMRFQLVLFYCYLVHDVDVIRLGSVCVANASLPKVSSDCTTNTRDQPNE